MNEVSRPPRPSVWQLAWPAVITNLLQSMVGLVDVKVVGTLGAPAVAAATAGHRLFFILQAILLAISAGTTALVARSWGAGQRDEASLVVGSSLALGSAVAFVMGVLGLATADGVSALLGLSGEALGLAATYVRWISVFNVVFAVGLILGAGLRAAGDMRTPLFIGVITNAVNVLLLFLFVYGGFGFPKLGIAGAALAGGFAFLAGTGLTVLLWLRGTLLIKPVARGVLDRARTMKLVRVGYPAALEQFVFQSGFIVFTFVIAHFYGTNALAAYGIGVQILSLSFVVGFGFSLAASTLVGQHLGAGDPARASASGWRAMWLAIGSMSVLSLIIVPLARPIAKLMITTPEVVEHTVTFIWLLGAAQPLMAIEFAIGGALRGAGDTRFPLLTTFTSLIGGRLVLALLFTWLSMPIGFIYGALLVDYTLKATMLILRFRSNRWQHALAPSLPPPLPLAVASKPPQELSANAP